LSSSRSFSPRAFISATRLSIRRQDAVERLGLRHRARKTVKNEALTGVRLVDTLPDNTDHEVIGAELAARHDLLHLSANRGACLHGGAEHVSCR
jgi:hypothetical protein